MLRNLYDLLTGDEDARVCKDIPERLCDEQPRNFFTHLIALSLTKIGDELANAKTTLPWLVSAVGAPAFLIAWLVPIRESLSLLPQLIVARYIREVPVRKWFWVGGSVVQGLSLTAMAFSAWYSRGMTAGALIVISLVIFSLARGVCSVASKDVVGKTISKERRGSVSGYAASLAGGVAVGLGLWLTQGDVQHSVEWLAALLLVGCGLWVVAALVYANLAETPGATEGGGNALSEALQSLRLAWREPGLRHFLITRSLLLASPLAAPLIVGLAQKQAHGVGLLGGLLATSGAASAISGAVWGRLSDRSSRLVMAFAGALAALACVVVPLLTIWGKEISPYVYVAAFFALAVAHAGIRLGRKTYLVDMAGSDNRATYVAVSNTLIGLMLLATGAVVGVITSLAGSAWAVGVLALIAVAASLSAWRLKEA